MNKKIIFSGGGTGGHIFPAINLMNHFFDKKYEVILVTDRRGKKFISNYTNFNSYTLSSGTPTNKNIFKKFLSYFLIFFSIIKSIIILKKEKPDLVVGFGGYVSFPICFASKFYKLPLIIYENNMVIGRANKYLLSFSKKILLAKKSDKNYFEKYKNKIYEVGPILNKNIISNLTKKENGKKDEFSILVLGGSQGAEIFGSVIPEVIKMIKNLGYDIKIIQQCIVGQKNSLSNFYTSNKIKNYVFEFDEDILKFILSSSLAITRCGASTTAELVYTLTPFIAVPLKNSIDNHQYLNAKYYEDKGCCLLLEQDNFNTKNLLNLILENIENKNKLEKISENMKKIRKKDVYLNIENEIKELI